MSQYAPIDKDFSSVLNPPSGLGLYVGKVSNDWAPAHIKPRINRIYEKVLCLHTLT